MRVALRFVAVNGRHAMSDDDDAYVTEWFATIEDLAETTSYRPDEIRLLMLAGRLPLPSYIRSDGAQMVPPDLTGLLEQARSPDAFPAWFARHWDSAAEAVEEWDAYLRGWYVCLRHVTPENIKRKGATAAAIARLLEAPEPTSQRWLARLHGLVDELDGLEPPFAPYDRLHFAGPLPATDSIDEVRERFPRGGVAG